MARYRVEFRKSARKEFDRVPAKVQDRILEALAFLAENPFSELLRIRKLREADSVCRIRIGDYRVVYEVRHDCLLVSVIQVVHRGEAYRNL